MEPPSWYDKMPLTGNDPSDAPHPADRGRELLRDLRPDRMQALAAAGLILTLLVAMALPQEGVTPDLRSDAAGALLAMAAILSAGAVIGAAIVQRLGWRLLAPEVARLLHEAKVRPDEHKSVPGWRIAEWQLLLVASLALSLVLQALLTGSSPNVPDWPWLVPAALALSEVIYLASAAEALAMQAELEALARHWARRSSAMALEGSTSSRNLDPTWQERARELSAALQRHGWVPAIYSARRSGPP
jgi:hypothetical protein